MKDFVLEKNIGVSSKVLKYVYEVGNRISDVKNKLVLKTKEKFPEDIIMLTDPAESQLLEMLVKLTNSKKGIEVGTFTGYSALCLASGLPEDGKLYCLDISETFTNLAKDFWKEAGVDKKIELILGPGIDTLNSLLEKEKKSFDFAYVDADKPNYINYYELLLLLVKKGGWIVFDNVLWNNLVIEDNPDHDERTTSLIKLNKFLQTDTRVEINMLPFADGVTIVRVNI